MCRAGAIGVVPTRFAIWTYAGFFGEFRAKKLKINYKDRNFILHIVDPE
jgi:hypothetical protein